MVDRDLSFRDIAVDYLNRAHDADPSAIQTLMNYRVPCSNLEDSNPITIRSEDFTTSSLGLLNGLMLALGAKPVYLVIDESDQIRFE